MNLNEQPLRHLGDQDTAIAFRIIGSGPALRLIRGYPAHGHLLAFLDV
jgi:hypothetical protein